MLTRWSDFDRNFVMMDELRRRMDQFFGDFDAGRGALSASAWPRLSVFDTGAALVVKAEVPGLAQKDVQLTINQDVLTLSGERKPDAPEGYSVHRQERAPFKFARSIALPSKIDPEKATATLKDGVLTISLGKAAEAQPKQISVTAG